MNRDFIKIIDVAKSGDSKAYEDLYNMTKDSAYFVALSITKNEHDAMDILQDSYIKAFDSLSTLRQPEVFDSWLNRIVANNSKRYISKNKPLLFGDMSNDILEVYDEEAKSSDNVPHKIIDNQETSKMVMDVIDNLSEDKKLIVIMYYYQEMMVKEISETLDLPITTVKYKLLSARQDMKKDILNLEKKGMKIYSVAPLAIISSAMFTYVSSLEVPAFASVLPAVMSGVGGVTGAVAIGSSGVMSTSGVTGAGIAGGVGTAGIAAVTEGIGIAGGTVAGTTAITGSTVVGTTAAVTGATAAGGVAGFLATAGGKAVATTLAVAVIGGGTTVAVLNNEKDNNITEIVTTISAELEQDITIDNIITETIINEETTSEKNSDSIEQLSASDIRNMTTEGYSSIDSIKKETEFEVSYTDVENVHGAVKYKGKYALTVGGKEDEITVFYDGDHLVYIEINGEINVFGGDYISNVEIVDIDKNDEYLELVLFDEGPSADPQLKIFRYADNSIIELGNFGGMFESTLFDGKGRIIAGWSYYDFIETQIVTEFVEVKENIATTYNPDYSELLNKKYKLTRDLTVGFKETQDINDYPDVENIIRIEKGSEITIISGTSNGSCFYIELQDGKRGVITTQLAG